MSRYPDACNPLCTPTPIRQTVQETCPSLPVAKIGPIVRMMERIYRVVPYQDDLPHWHARSVCNQARNMALLKREDEWLQRLLSDGNEPDWFREVKPDWSNAYRCFAAALHNHLGNNYALPDDPRITKFLS